MPFTQLLFSFRGRINRAIYWLTTLALLAILIALAFVAVMSGGFGALIVLLLISYIPLLWIGLAIGAKRLHDRDKSAWWLLVFYVLPSVLQGIAEQGGGLGFVFNLAGAAIAIWGIVELGFLRGTDGPNQYGPDPLQQAANVQPA
ncbi:MAG TPA: DUF805 domain-containing protein [Xanthobacteraceae bacterium]|nr:DUF805 domain-containing protein [Xanthobacteraceae bacterium]